MSVAAAPRLLDVGRWAPALAPLVAAAFVLALYTDSVPLVAAAVLGPPVLVAIAVRPEWGLALVLAAAPFISVAVPVGPREPSGCCAWRFHSWPCGRSRRASRSSPAASIE